MNFKSKKNETKDNPTTLKGGTTSPECIRCGTCCKKGGPCFHIEDRMLIEKGKIPATFLYTIRKGELARDNVRGCLKPVDSDVVKIKSKIDSWACILFDEEKKISADVLRAEEFLKANQLPGEIIVVDDGSTDKTFELVSD